MARRKGRISTGDLGVNTSDIFPAGTVLDFAGSTAPDGWLLCYGQAVSRTTYARLFAQLSTTYGSGDGSTTFNLPDLRGRTAVGKDDMGGAAASRVTSGGSGITGTTLGATGGAETHTLTEAQLPSHTHTQASHTHFAAQSVNGSSATSSNVTNSTSIARGVGTSANGEAYNLRAGGGTADVGLTNSATPSINSTGSGSVHQNTQPSIILNKIIKV